MKTTPNKKTLPVLIGIAALTVFIFAFKSADVPQMATALPGDEVSEANKKCIACHEKTSNGKVIVAQWRESAHGKNGTACLDCHAAKKEDLDAFTHEGETIATIVTPNDCSNCHDAETDQFTKSHHADAGMILGSLDNVLAEVVEGHAAYGNGANPAAANGCWQCHGSKVALLKDADGKNMLDENGILMYDPKTWPNTGIGRMNLDGSKGSCSACHTRHNFSSAQARQPENCGKCHMGPDHPQIEIYNESKHGINYRASREEMNLGSKTWIVGQDYSAAPTCATCHISATPTQKITHDAGDRISWTLRPPVSQKVDEALLAKFKKIGQEPPATFQNWEKRRENMVDVCVQCHAPNFVENFYTQYDSQVNLYNDKYGKPATKIFNALKEKGLKTDTEFDEKIEWTYFYLWHHEGRRARMGASMMAPDYTQWHGNYEVAERFYMEFVPEVKEILEKAKTNGKEAEAKEVEAMLDELLNNDMHKWFLGKVDPEEARKRQEAAKEFRKRYSE